MTDAVVVLDDRHPRTGHDFFDQAFAAARDDEVEVLIHLRHVLHTGAVGEGNELYAVRRQASSFTTSLQCSGEGHIRVNGLAAATQQGGVAGFKTKAGSIRGDVWPGFENDADDADGDALFGDVQTVGAAPVGEDFPHRIRQGRDFTHGVSHGFEALGIEREAVDHGLAQALFSGMGQVLGIGFQDVPFPGLDLIRHGDEDGVFLLTGKFYQLTRGSPRLAAHVEDGRMDFRISHVSGSGRRNQPRVKPKAERAKNHRCRGKRLKIDCQRNDLSGKYNAATKLTSPSYDKNDENP